MGTHVRQRPCDGGAATTPSRRGPGYKAALFDLDVIIGESDPTAPSPASGSAASAPARAREASSAAVHGAVRLLRRLHEIGVRTAVVSSYRDCAGELGRAGLGHLFSVSVDRATSDPRDIPGEPRPALLLEAARRLEVEPADALVVAGGRDGVAAGLAGGFARVVWVDREAPVPRDDHLAFVIVAGLGELERECLWATGEGGQAS